MNELEIKILTSITMYYPISSKEVELIYNEVKSFDKTIEVIEEMCRTAIGNPTIIIEHLLKQKWDEELDTKDRYVTKCCEYDKWDFQAGDRENVFCRKCKKWTKLKRIPYWEKEFEDEILYWSQYDTIKDLIIQYIKPLSKVKIKCKDGCIQIERVE